MFIRNEYESEAEKEARRLKEQSRKAVKEAGLAWIDTMRALTGAEDPNKKKKK